MVNQTQLALNDATDWLGEWHPLAEQLGSADGLLALSSVSASLRLAPVQSVTALRNFLRGYHARILLPHEFPAIQRACEHAAHHELRELVALDQSLAWHDHGPVGASLRTYFNLVGAGQSLGFV